MRWTNGMIKQIALQQSAIDANCSVKDFTCGENVVTISKENVLARKYLNLPHVCNLISYGDNIVATISEEYRDIVKQYINKYNGSVVKTKKLSFYNELTCMFRGRVNPPSGYLSYAAYGRSIAG